MEIVTSKSINPNDVYKLINSSNAGSVVFHFAVVRGTTDDKSMNSIEFRAAKDSNDIKRELHSISDELRKQFKVDDVLAIRAIGKLNVGDIMALVAVSSPHREPAFDACRYGVERLREMKSIVKQETFK